MTVVNLIGSMVDGVGIIIVLCTPCFAVRN